MGKLRCAALFREPHHRFRREHGLNRRDAELDRLLDDEVHPVAARESLHQGDGERGFAFARMMRADLDRDRAARGGDDA